MRLGSLILLTVLAVSSATYAEETLPTAPVITQQAATAAEVTSSALESQLQQQVAQQTQQLQAANKENQRLKQQLDQALSDSAPSPLITEQQMWYIIGAASVLLGMLAGSLLRGSRRTRREWLN
jgi:SH3 domain protein